MVNIIIKVLQLHVITRKRLEIVKVLKIRLHSGSAVWYRCKPYNLLTMV